MQVQHNPSPLEDCFLCLWLDCGFKTPSSEEMVDYSILSIAYLLADPKLAQVRHVNFHGFHTKIKAHGRALLERENLPRCRLSQRYRIY